MLEFDYQRDSRVPSRERKDPKNSFVRQFLTQPEKEHLF
jgi:hypothetical protein